MPIGQKAPSKTFVRSEILISTLKLLYLASLLDTFSTFNLIDMFAESGLKLFGVAWVVDNATQIIYAMLCHIHTHMYTNIHTQTHTHTHTHT